MFDAQTQYEEPTTMAFTRAGGYTRAEMRFFMEAQRVLKSTPLDRAYDILRRAYEKLPGGHYRSVAGGDRWESAAGQSRSTVDGGQQKLADKAMPSTPLDGRTELLPDEDNPLAPERARGRPPVGGQPETDAGGRASPTAAADDEGSPPASVRRNLDIMRHVARKAAIYAIDGEDVMQMPLGRVRTLARKRSEESLVLAEIARRYGHLPDTMIVGDLLNTADLETLVKDAKRDANDAF